MQASAARTRRRRKLIRYWAKRLGIELTPEFVASLDDESREQLLIGGQQAGKSTNDAFWLFIEILMREPRPGKRAHLYWIVVTDYGAPHKELDYIAEWFRELRCVDWYNTPQGGSCRLSLMAGNVHVETITGKDPEGIAGEPCDAIIAVEAGQMVESVRNQMQTRVMAKRGRIRYSGTLEDDENKPRWAWYAELAEAWLKNASGAARRAFSLPTWANRAVVPLGAEDPEIARLREALDSYTFDRRIAARPTGVQGQVYPQVTQKCYLIPLKGGACPMKPAAIPRGYRWADGWLYPPQGETKWEHGAGGIDFGGAHPSALTAITEAEGEAWVRECTFLKGRDLGADEAGDTGLIAWHRARLSQKFELTGHGASVYDGGRPISRWGLDPNVRHSGLEDSEPVSGSAGSREARFGYGITRLNNASIFFDSEGEGVSELYAEIGRVHRVKGPSGQVVIWRMHDDRAASWEDALEMLDGGPPPPPEGGFGSTDLTEKPPTPTHQRSEAHFSEDRNKAPARPTPPQPTTARRQDIALPGRPSRK